MADKLFTGATLPQLGVEDQVEQMGPAMPGEPEAPGQPEPKPFKFPNIKKRDSFKVDAEKVVDSVINRYHQDLRGRQTWEDDRLQRYAKLRGWNEAKEYPWPNASNAHIPLMMQNSQRTQDTLQNAVLVSRPAILALPINKAARDKGTNIDHILDYQFFVEQPGEEKLGTIISGFVDDGKSFVYVAWVEDRQFTVESFNLGAAPEDQDPRVWIVGEMQKIFSQAATVTPQDENGVKWVVSDIDYSSNEPVDSDVEFAQDDEGEITAYVSHEVCLYKGPCVFPKAVEDVIVPANATNVQAPSPSNPRGAQHVMLRDYPTEDEILRLARGGDYDLVTKKKLEEILAASKGRSIHDAASDGQEPVRQKAALAGVDPHTAEGKHCPKQFTRLLVFDRWDVNDDGLEEDVVFTVLLEPRLLLRAKYMTELFPFPVPRRPIAAGDFLPVPNEMYGISQLELLEGVQDMVKTMLDQSIDNATLSTSPVGFYRAASGLRPEVIRFQPGDLIPTANPKDDFHFPQIGNANSQTFWINMITMLEQQAERLSMQGALQMGGVPAGKSAALRTSQNMQALLQQGDARPERILRRLFHMLADIWQLMHMLDVAYLEKNKEYRILGPIGENDTPYKVLEDPSALKGMFTFDFKASVINTNKAAMEQSLDAMAATLISPFMFQVGMVDQEKVYNIIHDGIKIKGHDPDRYIKRPPNIPDAPSVMAEEAIVMIMNGEMPTGMPAEGAAAHLAKLQEFHNSDAMGYMKEAALQLYVNYVRDIMQLAQQEQQKQTMMQAAGQQQQLMQQQGQQVGPGAPPSGMPPAQDTGQKLNPNELMDQMGPQA